MDAKHHLVVRPRAPAPNTRAIGAIVRVESAGRRMTRLVTAGIFRYTRNPMYLGLLVVLTGWAVHVSNAAAFALLPLFVAYMWRFQIVPEERAMGASFGADYAAYTRRVRRWL